MKGTLQGKRYDKSYLGCMPQPEGCLTGLLRLLLGGSARSPNDESSAPSSRADPLIDSKLPYGLRDDFLSPAELSFYRVATHVLAGRAVLCPKVRLADLFFVARPNENFRYFNSIAQKHVDFVLCSPDTMHPWAGIELDDASHEREDRQRRDIGVERVFEAARLPLLRVPVRSGYSAPYIEDLVRGCLSGDPTGPVDLCAHPADAEPIATDSLPHCPKCGLVTVLRQARRGAHRGEVFYGCPDYPRCRLTRPIKRSP
jgi:hypothetical protein